LIHLYITVGLGREEGENDLTSFGFPDRSRHVIQGSWRMFKSVGAGVVTGVIGAVYSPIAGANQGGVIGLAAGLAAGAIGTVLLPVMIA
jgi:hypothetical protein